MLNETNFKIWKEVVDIIIGCMDLDLTLRIKKLFLLQKTLKRLKLRNENKRSIQESFKGSIFKGQRTRKFLEVIEQFFCKK
ncbi:hypothetical protein CR513_02898, partial [Mucuna pruriens]